MNYFAFDSAAERYARNRPYFHPLVMDRVKAFLDWQEPLTFGVDIACGTGQSAMALADLVRRVLAVDSSSSMLAHAPKHPKIRYVQGVAEELPLANRVVDLMTVSLAFHWLDHERFLTEAHRVMRPGATMVIYWNDFQSHMSENPDFTEWWQEVYMKRYPTPPRAKKELADEDAEIRGFVFAKRETYSHERAYTPEKLVRYLVTHSNVIAAVEGGGESLADVEEWLLEGVRPLFAGTTGTFRFGGDIWYLQSLPAYGEKPPAPRTARSEAPRNPGPENEISPSL